MLWIQSLIYDHAHCRGILLPYLRRNWSIVVVDNVIRKTAAINVWQCRAKRDVPICWKTSIACVPVRHAISRSLSCTMSVSATRNNIFVQPSANMQSQMRNTVWKLVDRFACIIATTQIYLNGQCFQIPTDKPFARDEQEVHVEMRQVLRQRSTAFSMRRKRMGVTSPSQMLG
jgi:hypothetical protein